MSASILKNSISSIKFIIITKIRKTPEINKIFLKIFLKDNIYEY